MPKLNSEGRARPGRRVAAALAVTVAATLPVGVAASSPATAENVPLTTSGEAVLSGHGYGHGRGMSQWGAYGAATRGLSWDRIVAFYYPGTGIGTYGNPTLRIRLSEVSSTAVTAVMSAGLKLQTPSGAIALSSSARGRVIDRWRLVRDGGGQSLQFHAGGAWTTNATYRRTARTLTFARVGGAVRVLLTSGTYRDYPDRVRSVVSGGGALVPLNVTSLDSYLRGVVPSEMPASWPAEALRSQAVVARTYAANQRTSGLYDLCDSTACQVYRGLADYSAGGALIRSNTHPNADAAVTATSGRVVTYAGEPAFTQFSASNGGWTVDGGKPYLVAKADPYDGVPTDSWSPHSWTVSGATLRAALQRSYPSVGTVTSLGLVRDGRGEWGGRVVRATLVGTSGRATLSGDQLRFAAGLRSTWFALPDAVAPKPPTSSAADLLGKDTGGAGHPDVYGLTSTGVLYRMQLAGSSLGDATFLGRSLARMTTIAYGGNLDGTPGGDLLARGPRGQLWCYSMPTSGPAKDRRRVTGIPGSLNRLAGIGDATSDGRDDVIGIDRGTGALWLYAGNGACGFTRARRIGVGWRSMNLLVGAGDTNRDGHVDFWARQRGNGALWTYHLTGSGAVKDPRVRVGVGWQTMRDIVAVGNVDGAGGSDLLARDRRNRLWLYPGTGTGRVGRRIAITREVSHIRLMR